MKNELCYRCHKYPWSVVLPVITGYVFGCGIGTPPPAISTDRICEKCYNEGTKEQEKIMKNKLTPLDIMVLTTHHYLDGTLLPVITDKVTDSIRKLMSLELMIENNLGNGEWNRTLTEGGNLLVEALCSTPIPIKKWVMPDKE